MTSDTKNSPNSRLFGCDKAVAQTIAALISCYQPQGKLLVCGNGGSAATIPADKQFSLPLITAD